MPICEEDAYEVVCLVVFSIIWGYRASVSKTVPHIEDIRKHTRHNHQRRESPVEYQRSNWCVISAVSSPELRERKDPLLRNLLLDPRVRVRDGQDVPKCRQRNEYPKTLPDKFSFAKDLIGQYMFGKEWKTWRVPS